jgi:hypothetical protein
MPARRIEEVDPTDKAKAAISRAQQQDGEQKGKRKNYTL